MQEDLEVSTPTNESDQDTNPVDEPKVEMVKKEAYDNQKTRAEKAERKAKELEAKLAKESKQETPEREVSSEPDYAKEAFLEQRGIKHPDDKKLVYKEAERLKLPLTDVLGMEHIEAKLKKAKTQREAEDGMPESGGKPSGVSKNTVDYWKDKKNSDGTFATPTDPELAQKVIEARIKTEGKNRMFDEDLGI